ncbi:hypothetical protein [Kitasatospora sp. A2-31]|uniref:hypothetical protein n=1 Tax=Kitasatospora sp. A2-31 TaxID=2916414 RepID=UPI001EEB4885|nr:hypothetical protein [Kitasatospora sp. A2-31]MCG6496646.1 hypothetical protein [Kitasatospora sp. A2-31]
MSARPARKGRPRVLLTIRVSDDGGRTFRPARTYTTDDDLTPPLVDVWPPCRCPLHR